jgi:hypothetical protein
MTKTAKTLPFNFVKKKIVSTLGQDFLDDLAADRNQFTLYNSPDFYAWPAIKDDYPVLEARIKAKEKILADLVKTIYSSN